MEPKVLILDEPTAGLDPVGSESISGKHPGVSQGSDATIIMVSHSMEEMARTVDRLVVGQRRENRPGGRPPAWCSSTARSWSAWGWAFPQVTRVFNRLRAMGVDVASSVYTIEQAKAAILDALAKKGVGWTWH